MHLRIKETRKDAGLTQAEFAEKLSVATGTVKAWESGSRVPSQTALYAIADMFKVRRDWLENGVEPMRYPEPDRDAESEMISALTEDIEDPVCQIVRDIMFAYIELDPDERHTAKKYAASILERVKDRYCVEKEKPKGFNPLG